MKKTAILLLTDGGYWAKGKTFSEAIKNLQEISTLRMSTKINITTFICNPENEDWYDVISSDGLSFTYNQGDTYYQEEESFSFGEFFNMFGVCADFLNKASEKNEKQLNNLVMRVERVMEEHSQKLEGDEYDDIAYYS